ncbi:MAG: hypothetical protein NTV69_13800 [Caldilinea sp.]|nr:hypothetical protein [Caldilinea sp.]
MTRKYLFGLLAFTLLLFVAWMAEVRLPPSALAATQESPLPEPESPLPSPEPPGPVDEPSEESAADSLGRIFTGNAAVELSPPGTAGKIAIRFRTQQSSVGWWDACGRLVLAPNLGGYADIPAGAAEISIPGDVTGQFSLVEWSKTKRPNGEWVLQRNFPHSCTEG